MRPPFATAVLAVVLVGGCAGTAARPASPPADSAPQPVATTLTIENILQWPLEGVEGFLRAVTHLHDATSYEVVAPLQSVSLEPFRTADGYRVETVWFKDRTQSVSIGLDDSPCVDVRSAAASIDANQEAIHQGSHGEDVGKKYASVRNGVVVRISTANTSSACVQNIYIDVSKNRNLL